LKLLRGRVSFTMQIEEAAMDYTCERYRMSTADARPAEFHSADGGR
jgi:hypothetical protein